MPSERGDRPSKLRAKNIALGLALLGFVVLFYFVTVIRMAENTH
jgi:hypothetical protein